MNAALDQNRVPPAEIEAITGIPPSSPWKQRNRLQKQGIKAFVNARRECVTFWSWVEAAGLPEEKPEGYSQPDDEIELDFSSLRGKHGGDKAKARR